MFNGEEMALYGAVVLLLIVQVSAQYDNATVIEFDHLKQMTLIEYLGKQLQELPHYIFNNETEDNESFVGRCIGIAKKIRQIMPFVMLGAGMIITKLGFLVLFSLKTLGLLGMLLLLNVGTTAAKLGAFLASKKHDDQQYLHVHVEPSKKWHHEESYSSLKGPPYGWDDRQDVENHELYNLYEKLKMENDLRRRYLALL